MTTLHEALVAVMNEVREVRKDQYNQQQKFSFRGVDDVVNAVAGPMRRNNVRLKVETLEHSIRGGADAKGRNVTFVVVKNSYTWVGPDGDTESNTMVAEARDFGDKATAKAHSVALRTFLLQSLMLPTDDVDPDHEYIEGDGGAPQGNDAPQAVNGPNWEVQYQEAERRGPQAMAKWARWASPRGLPQEYAQRIADYLQNTPENNTSEGQANGQ